MSNILTTTRAIPLVNLADYEHGSDAVRQAFVDQLADAFRGIGFVGVTGHGIPKQLIDDFYVAAKKFFAMDTDGKGKYEIPGAAGQRGYTAFGKEKAKQSQVADLKEFFQIGQETINMTTEQRNPDVAEVPEFMTLGRELYRQFEVKGNVLLEAIASYLELPANYFSTYTKDGISILRAIHYPPISSEPASAIRAEQHEDINLITLLVGASAGGLELLNANGEWQEVVPENDEIVINVGDMLQRLTNNHLKSTTHRVVNPPRAEWHKPRLSIPFFLHPRPEMSLDVLASCVTADNPRHYEAITAGGYLDQRLREIGLKK
ncbi:isopenicillin N synthase family dioxygenase [Neolewinella antarctica]|uniref:2-oxoglutarate-dependent ethylene/succinate-forming enzyme n=1 Tax=Neolewinella antarctica TaxID=442734 RepID=A0ABX0XGP0_9BACT|nr:isopenicillin N synthase family oxygenase [Neolewinella antarctica]NJC27917.1 isopenicillin N synthase-like dioxygenase [Neolewinella antarctica]